MIKEMTVAQCDLCGSIAPAVYEYCQREDESWYTHPKDWHLAIEALKAQEPRKPHYTTLQYVVNGKVKYVEHPECPKCWDNGLTLWDAEIQRGVAYCKRCGQAVRWDG